MNAAVKYSEERLMKVLLAPVISEKATFVAEKNEQVVFLVSHSRKFVAYLWSSIYTKELN